jgi:hypothetical protein
MDLLTEIEMFCKSNVIVSIDNKFSDDYQNHEQQSYYTGQIEAFNKVITFINHKKGKN